MLLVGGHEGPADGQRFSRSADRRCSFQRRAVPDSSPPARLDPSIVTKAARRRIEILVSGGAAR